MFFFSGAGPVSATTFNGVTKTNDAFLCTVALVVSTRKMICPSRRLSLFGNKDFFLQAKPAVPY